MSTLLALLLGIVQGLTEFLPVSSSGHLAVVPWLLDDQFLRENPAFNKTFDVALHAGTLVAVLIYFRTELGAVIRGGLRSLRRRAIDDSEERLAWVIVVGTIPAVIVGGLFEDFIDRELGDPWLIAVILIVFGGVLYVADRAPQRYTVSDLKISHGLIIGMAQALALSPGTSRSGVTISAARFLGLDREAAARISFLLLVPVVAGATILKGYGAAVDGLPDGVIVPMIVGTLASALSGYAAIAGLLALVRRHSYDAFVVYRLALGGGILLLIALGVRAATF
ncbi:MAG: undecaprenyl-diphosphatase UppP [Solirubrobacterales bacterium]